MTINELERLLSKATSTHIEDVSYTDRMSDYINALRNAAPALIAVVNAAKNITEIDGTKSTYTVEGKAYEKLQEKLKALDEVEL